MYRVMLYGEPRTQEQLEEGLNLGDPGAIALVADEGIVREKGRAARVLMEIEYWTGTMYGEKYAVGC